MFANVKKWIVMIEDDVDMHYLYERVFYNLQLGDRLKLFDNAHEALAFINSESADTELIFSDINMPMIDGLELKKKINESGSSRSRHIPFVFMTTSATEYDVKRSLELNIQGFFQKGDTLDEIQNTIDLVISRWTTSAVA